MADIDEAFLNELAEDLPLADLRNVARTFEADMQRLSAALATAAAAADLAAFRRVAHAIAGAASAVGATNLEQTARAAMQQVDTSAAAAQAAAMAGLATQAVVALGAFLSGRSRMA